MIDRVTDKFKDDIDSYMLAGNETPIPKLEHPFLRMFFEDALKYCHEHKIYKYIETNTHFEFGDDISKNLSIK